MHDQRLIHVALVSLVRERNKTMDNGQDYNNLMHINQHIVLPKILFILIEPKKRKILT